MDHCQKVSFSHRTFSNLGEKVIFHIGTQITVYGKSKRYISWHVGRHTKQKSVTFVVSLCYVNG